MPMENAYYGEGLLVLFEGSAAADTEVYSIFNGSVVAGDMPLAEVRRIVAGGR